MRQNKKKYMYVCVLVGVPLVFIYLRHKTHCLEKCVSDKINEPLGDGHLIIFFFFPLHGHNQHTDFCDMLLIIICDHH